MAIQKRTADGKTIYRGTCELCGYKTPVEYSRAGAEYTLNRHEAAQHGGNMKTGAGTKRGSHPMRTKK
jgi:hypothetical protein